MSFGAHFFQDLVEARIHYLPLYPDDEGVIFNEAFLTRSPNLLAEFLPDYAALADTVHLIDVPESTDGLTLQLLMNADLNEAVALLRKPGNAVPETIRMEEEGTARQSPSYSRWRMRMAEQIAADINPEEFGVAAMYIFSSTKNATAGPASDIDLLIHFRGTPTQRYLLDTWLRGWSLCLDEVNYLQTGYRSGGILDVHIVTDEDIEKKISYAAKIDAVTDAARPLSIRQTFT
ncbi:MAG TPA: nucleotidyltransferase domain-containing protein [Acidobacteriota bacterium]|nr:nucleotidyltransferase domain-containing protein [Acidobacteriota bacterium]